MKTLGEALKEYLEQLCERYPHYREWQQEIEKEREDAGKGKNQKNT